MILSEPLNPMLEFSFQSKSSITCGLRLVCTALLVGTIIQSEVHASDLDFFEREVRPLLVASCYECHSAESGKSKGGLRLDTREGWQRGGDSGPALVPNQPEASLLVRAIHYSDPDLEMPPNGKLSSEKIEVLEHWIRSGAIDPRTAPSQAATEEIDIEEGKKFWSFQSLSPAPPPPVNSEEWPNGELDHFILSKLEDAGLSPNPPAGEATLIRRLYFDLIGLPPTPNQLQEALALPTNTRLSELVDRLLASKHFGETWGRHWLDLARYSESTGGGRSALLPNAWRYRNYVIDAFNNDKPFDQFVREQIAGDLLPYQDDRQRAEQLTATAFLVLGPKNLDLQDKELLRMNTVDEQIDTVSRVFMGITLSCARCHDHKFDPIPAKDYYALAGIFRSTRTLKRSNVSTLTHRDLPTSTQHREAVAAFAKSKRSLDQKIKSIKSNKEKGQPNQLAQLESELTRLLRAEPDPIPQTLGVIDEDETENYHLCIRGNVHQLGEEVPRGFVQVMTSDSIPLPEIPTNQSGRVELAHWLSHPDHPLVARVIVNRVWQHLFGEGLVRTVDNFGTQGERPSHPELLDYLALQFIENNWSIKGLIRTMVLSKTYQLSSANQPSQMSIDAENRLRWRMPRRRLAAEAIRDAMMSVAGTLSHQTVECLFPEAAQRDTALQKASLDVPALVNPPLRSIYIPVLREEGLNPLLKAFDFANPSFPVGRRNQSILPTQALYLMNSKFVMQQASIAAERFLKQSSERDNSIRLKEAYLSAIGRPPNDEERRIAREYLNDLDHDSSLDIKDAWTHLFHSLFASVDFRFLK